ncbi:lytic transglycosylase domain-containing protein [Jannaschia ovalis]|uniref:Lytic transglycosylase domain-containing protein n=1 Tax=Jannaschia ovalis TaxID=3038773 RepID=A0ABY8LEF7_9RHOB|nr:lytic transglycosylase domain-containing protein [Jannaschia sp. GRR-S6-38]WGH79706.1 lytic transglycosylase domain-containing protein [Jannaschia sp. GRR-S6-38]
MLRLVLILILLAAPLRADPPPAIHCSEGRDGPRHCIRADRFAADLCRQIEAEAKRNRLPPAFLARLLWQESRFDPRAVSPKRAMGIAQFIASTARLRGLENPFNPAEAIEKSADYLGEMTRRYGNVGLAAIGYNGGERRVEGFIRGTGGLARETIDYVAIITGHRAEDWRDAPPQTPDFALNGRAEFQPACRAMAANRRVTPMTPPPPRISPWGVQVAWGRSDGAARAAHDRLRRSCRSIVPERRVELVPVAGRGPGRPDIVAVRLGAGTQLAAAEICRRVANAGCPCRVFRN